jgi:hypothetical protein
MAGSLVIRHRSLPLVACLDYLPLLLSNINTPLELLSQVRVLRLEARGQAGEPHVMNACAVLGAHGSGGPSSEGTRSVDDVVVVRQVEPAGSMARSGEVRGRRLLLDNDLGCL